MSNETAIDVAAQHFGQIKLSEGTALPVIGDYGDYLRLAEYLVAHGMHYGHTVDSAAGAICAGHPLGLTPQVSLQYIAMVRDRPTIWGSALLSLAKASPRCKSIVGGCWRGPQVSHAIANPPKGDFAAARARQTLVDELAGRYHNDKRLQMTDFLVGWAVTIDDSDMIHVSVFDISDAETAGLLRSKGAWTSYPQRMCMQRARTFLIRDTYPEVMIFPMTTEEARDSGYSDIIIDTSPKPDKVDAIHKEENIQDAEMAEPEPPPVVFEESAQAEPDAPPVFDEVAALAEFTGLRDELKAARGGQDVKQELAAMAGKGWKKMSVAEKREYLDRVKERIDEVRGG